MAGGRFEVVLEPNADESPQAHGLERCEFLVSANPGQPPRALRKVASGGELARISLAIEVATLGLDPTPTMVFDEVDSGIGGAVAEVVGQKLRALGGPCQVLCVTHLAQVASQGHLHYQVRKIIDDGSTESLVSVLGPRGADFGDCPNDGRQIAHPADHGARRGHAGAWTIILRAVTERQPVTSSDGRTAPGCDHRFRSRVRSQSVSAAVRYRDW